ncbi:hypothetical protein MAFF212519_03890 [Clavibacter michiganensis]
MAFAPFVRILPGAMTTEAPPPGVRAVQIDERQRRPHDRPPYGRRTRTRVDRTQRTTAADGPRGGRPSGPLGRFHHRRWGDAWLIGLLGFLLALPLAGAPSVWYDEAATVISATRGWDDLLRELSTVDAVHGLYYAGMKVWFELVGYSPTSLRFPSAVFIGLAAAGVVLLTRTISTRATGIVAGLVFVVIPRSAWMGTEGRSFALGTLIAVALTVAFVLAARRAGSRWQVQARWWALYGLLAWLGASTFVYLALLVGAHGVVILWAIASARVGAAAAGPWSSRCSAGRRRPSSRGSCRCRSCAW